MPRFRSLLAKCLIISVTLIVAIFGIEYRTLQIVASTAQTEKQHLSEMVNIFTKRLGKRYRLVSPWCSTSTGCVFENMLGSEVTPLGLGNLTGYFTRVTHSDLSSMVCNAFVVQDGTASLVDHIFDQSYERYGGVIHTEADKPAISIRVDLLDDESTERLQSSSAEMPVEITVLRPAILGSGNPCTPQAEVLVVTSFDGN